MTQSHSPRQVALELAAALRDEMAPQLGGHAGRAHAGAGEGGDITFAIDEHAEAFMERVLVVDPIDGTRPAMAGLEAACVSVAVARLRAASERSDWKGTDGDPRMG